MTLKQYFIMYRYILHRLEGNMDDFQVKMFIRPRKVKNCSDCRCITICNRRQVELYYSDIKVFLRSLIRRCNPYTRAVKIQKHAEIIRLDFMPYGSNFNVSVCFPGRSFDINAGIIWIFNRYFFAINVSGPSFIIGKT